MHFSSFPLRMFYERGRKMRSKDVVGPRPLLARPESPSENPQPKTYLANG